MQDTIEARCWVLIAGDFTPLGGMDRANHGLASYLARHAGSEVHLVTHRTWHDLASLPDVRIHHVTRPGGRHLFGAPLLARAGRRVAQRFAPHGARVVVNGGNCGWGDINWVHYVHAAWRPSQARGLFRRTKARLLHHADLAAERASLRQARVVIANSQRTRSALIDRLGLRAENVYTVYYGNDPERFRPPSAAERAWARARLGWDDQRPTLAFVGALGDRRKGFDTLFEAWRRLVRDPGWDARLAVVGAGAGLGYWRQAAAALDGSITFLGFRRDVSMILQACDALVSPVRYEAYGLSVQEAICCGLPAFVTRSAGVAERYPAELTELLIPDPDDAADLADRLRRWRSRADRAPAALAAFSEQLRATTWDDMAEQFIRTTSDCAGCRKHSNWSAVGPM
jgi:glycosyltransferase involved in cell wall biosynthesis